MSARFIMIILLQLITVGTTLADEPPVYPSGRVVYDVSVPDAQALEHLLDRASLLQDLYQSNPLDASIVIVVHEAAIPLFAIENKETHGGLMRRASSLAMGDVIQFRLCLASARMQGYGEGDFPAFVALVPMADAEMVRLQQDGYAYLFFQAP